MVYSWRSLGSFNSLGYTNLERRIMDITLQTLALICFALGTGIWMLITHPTINEIAKWVGGIGGIVYGVLLILDL